MSKHHVAAETAVTGERFDAREFDPRCNEMREAM